MGAVFAVPLHVGWARFGALDLYRVDPGPLGPDPLADALVFAHAVTTGLLSLMAGVPPGSLPRAIDGALDDGAIVQQAAGMVSVQLDVGIEDALVAVRAHAYATGSAVSEVAAHVVSRDLRFGRGLNIAGEA